MGPFAAENHFRFERNGRVRSMDVAVRRYRDGAFVGCIRAPSQCGSFCQTVEVTPRVARETRELLRSTAGTLARALSQSPTHDSVGYLDIVGHAKNVLEGPLPATSRDVVGGLYDIVGFDLSALTSGFQAQVQGAQQRAATAIQSGAASQGALAGALSGAQSGGLAGAAAGAGRGLLEATGIAELGRAVAGPIYEAWAGGPTQGAPQSAADLQTRRNSALRDLYYVAGEASHADGVRNLPWAPSNWDGAVRWNTRNLGLQGMDASGRADAQSEFAMLASARTVADRRAILATLDPRSPYITDAGAIASPPGVLRARVAPRSPAEIAAGYPWPWSGAGAGTQNQDLVALLMAAQQANPQSAPVFVATTSALPGTAAAQVRPIDATTAGAALGASELLARALATIALERGSTRGEVQQAAEVARTVLRSVDAIAGARAGDPRARAAIRRAVNATSDRTARALRMGLAMVGG